MFQRLKLFRGPQGRIRNTLLRNMALIGLTAMAALFFILGFAIEKSFSALEQRELEANLGRISDFQKTSLGTLMARAKDWGIWNDSYEYAQDFNPGYETSNVNHDSFLNAEVDGLAVVRFRDKQARAFAFDRENGVDDAELAKALKAQVLRPEFFQKMQRHDFSQSFIVFNGQLYALASAQLHKSDGTGSPPGYLTFVQKITAQMASGALQVPADINLGARASGTQVDVSPNAMEVVAPFKGPDGKTVAAVHLHLPRPLTKAAQQLLLITFAGVSALVAVLLAVLSRRVRTLVLDPVERLHNHVTSIRETGNLRSMDSPAPANEFGALQTEFNSMTAELQQLRAQLESQSFTLGKSQSAVGLMHNLRNSLSPVRVILETLDQTCRDGLPPQAPRALSELSDGALDQQRREKLVSFLSAAHEHVGARNAAAQQQVREAARNLMNALDAIDAAAQTERDTRFDERCDLAGLLSHSANIARYAENINVAVDVQCNGYIAVTGNRVLLSQVFENLVTNALEAIQDSGRQDGAISLEATQAPGEGLCTITVTDNGAGFAPEAAAQLFERGFSTRASKSGGLGLHWCANTVRAMSGELQLESGGKGSGARAVIQLPLWHDQDTRNMAAA